MTETLTPHTVSAARIVAALRDAWQTPGAGRHPYSNTRPPFIPIADSGEDQTSHTDNPYWDVVRWMPAEPPWAHGGPLEPTYVHNAFRGDLAEELCALGAGSRVQLAARFAWSIITPGDIDWITQQLDGRPVVEIGAGTGYWAWQLEQAGVDVAAYDPNPPGPDNTQCSGGPYTTVLQDDASAVRHHQDRALLMVWPPYGGEHARHALSVYEGDLLLYAGEGPGGCTADDGFYELLDEEWVEVDVAPRHVTWWGIHCSLAAYRRQGGAA